MPRSLSAFALYWLLAILLLPSAGLCRENNSPAPKEGILLVAFGTTVPEAKGAFTAIDKAYRQAFPGAPIAWAFTSQIIRKKLASQGEPVGSIADGLEQLAKKGCKIIRVQSLHMLAGEEFAALARSVLINLQKHPARFQAVYLGRPLLESRRDGEDVARAALSFLNKDRQPGEAIVLMGHGQAHGRADLAIAGAAQALKKQDPLVFVATVEGSSGFDELASELQSAGVKKTLLAPLMIVAGDHARNDLAGDEKDSWASQLAKMGIQTRASLKGFGEMPGIAEIFIRHTKESEDNLVKEPVKP